MRTLAMTGLLALLTVRLAGPVTAETNQAAVDLATSGKIDVARASWWGFDPDDSTDALQAAINSGVKTLIVDNLGKPWIVRPMTLASNQTILFEPDTEVVAKRGEFKGTGDSLFTARDKDNISLIGYGATMRMRRSDYIGPDYKKAEWRMVLAFRGCSNIKVCGLTLAESGGDGIYLGRGANGATNRKVHIKDVVCDRNHRQGISVITAENLLIEDTVMSNTAGTAPAAGIDFEPNSPDERLVNIVMRGCTTRGNQGSGYFFYLPPLTSNSVPVSIRLENCKSFGEKASGLHIVTGATEATAVKGKIECEDCLFEGSGNAGIAVANNPRGAARISLANCTVRNAAVNKPDVSPITFSGKAAGIELIDCVVRDQLDRKPAIHTGFPEGVPAEAVTGTIRTKRPSRKQKITITPETLTK